MKHENRGGDRGLRTNADGEKSGISRRAFLSQSAVYGGTFLAWLNLPRPNALAAAHASSEPISFTREQWKTVEAITGRIIPTDHEPGAIEANCVNFIDKVLDNEDKAQKSIYDSGLQALEHVSRNRFDDSFLGLTDDQKDEMLASIESGSVEGWPDEAGASTDFFATVRGHTLIGFLADPKYGGNRNYAGWKVIGYPGPRHHAGGFTPEQMQGRARIRPVWE